MFHVYIQSFFFSLYLQALQARDYARVALQALVSTGAPLDVHDMAKPPRLAFTQTNKHYAAAVDWAFHAVELAMRAQESDDLNYFRGILHKAVALVTIDRPLH